MPLASAIFEIRLGFRLVFLLVFILILGTDAYQHLRRLLRQKQAEIEPRGNIEDRRSEAKALGDYGDGRLRQRK